MNQPWLVARHTFANGRTRRGGSHVTFQKISLTKFESAFIPAACIAL